MTYAIIAALVILCIVLFCTAMYQRRLLKLWGGYLNRAVHGLDAKDEIIRELTTPMLQQRKRDRWPEIIE